MSRELVFSVTEADCKFNYYRGTGKGGQKRNKTNSAVRCTHAASGAVGQSDDTRSQHQNKVIAFRRMALSDCFKRWHKLEVAKVTGKLAETEELITRTMRPNNLCIEGKDDQGRWTSIEDKGEDDDSR